MAAERSCQFFETLDLYRHIKLGVDPREYLGIVYVIQGNFAEAEKIGEQMRQDHEANGNRNLLAAALYVLTIANLAYGNEAGNRWFAA